MPIIIPKGENMEEHFKKIAGCLIIQKIGQLRNFSILFCPKCKKILFAKDEEYVCPACHYTTNKYDTDGAIEREKGRLGMGTPKS